MQIIMWAVFVPLLTAVIVLAVCYYFPIILEANKIRNEMKIKMENGKDINEEYKKLINLAARAACPVYPFFGK